MLRAKSWTKWPLSALLRLPWPPPTVLAPNLDKSTRIEEEKTPYYDPQRFYPTHLGEVLDGRYQIATKLGYGTSSTVWLARDLYQWRWSPERYVTIKINAINRGTRNVAESELHNTQVITNANREHEGWSFVRTLLDNFMIAGPQGDHVCLVFEPLREPLWLLNERFEGSTIPSNLLKIMVQMMLHGLDYLHRDCHIVHTDLKLDNIMVRLEDKSILDRDARDEREYPLPQKTLDDRKIYLSRNNYGQPSKIPGIVCITDFGLSKKGDVANYGCIQAEVYRAPEVILDAGWAYSADIWNLGVMLWDLLENKVLFEAVDPLKFEYNDQVHLAYITALIGAPPKELLSKGRRASMFYNNDGSLKAQVTVPVDFNFENSVNIIDGEDKIMFLDFVSRMLKWHPEERSTARDLLSDPWLEADFP